MRAWGLLVVAVVIAGLVALDAYQYDGRDRKVGIGQIDHQAANLFPK